RRRRSRSSRPRPSTAQATRTFRVGSPTSAGWKRYCASLHASRWMRVCGTRSTISEPRSARRRAADKPGAADPPRFSRAMRVALQIDGDTYHGLATGLPRLLDALGWRRLPASIYIAMGPDHSGRAVRRLFTHKGFVRKMFRSRALHLYGVRAMLYGTLLPGRQIARSFPNVL